MRLPGSEAALAAAERQVFLMKRIYLTVEDHLNEINTFEKGCWVHLQNPTREEIDGINARFALDPTYIQSALDEEESARIERDGDQTLIIVDIPYVEAEGNGYSYTTVPLGIIMVDDVIITVSTRESTIITDFTEERIRGFWTFKRTRFILQLLHRNASRFLASAALIASLRIRRASSSALPISFSPTFLRYNKPKKKPAPTAAMKTIAGSTYLSSHSIEQ